MIIFAATPISNLQENTPPRPALDEQLIAALGAGNQEAMVALYAQTKAAVFGFAWSILKNKHDAEDVMQETYLKIYTAAVSYQQRGKPMAWILTITRNLALMKLREANNRDLPLTDDNPPDPSSSWATETEAVLDRMVLTAAMTILSDEERQVVILHSLSGLKHREIADLLQCPLSTVLSKYRRALSKLNHHLKEDENNDR